MLVRNNWHKIFHFFENHRLSFLLVFLIVFLAVSWSQASPNFLDSNSFYHAKIIKSMENSLILDEFTWLQSTNFEQNFTDANWLYHLFLSLFVGALPIFLVVKLFGALSASLLALYIYCWLKKNNGKWPAVFVLLLFSSQIFIDELNILGAQALSLGLLLFGLDLIINYKYWQLGIVSIILVLVSGDFIFLLFVATAWLLVEFIYNRWSLDKFRTRFGNWRDFVLRKLGLRDGMGRKKWLVLIFCLAGLLLGVITHPYWPNNMSFYADQVLNNTVYSNFAGLAANVWYLVMGAFGVLLAMFVSLLAILYNCKKVSKLSASLILLMVVFFILSLIIEWGTTFFLLLSVILTSLLVRDLFGDKSWKAILNRKVSNSVAQSFINIVLLLIIVIIPLRVYHNTRTTINSGYQLDYMQGAANWLYYHTPDNSLVVNSDWQDWAPLFYYNDNNNYWWGLSANLMRNKYTQTFDDFIVMVGGQGDKNVKALLKDNFNADYILINKKRSMFNQRLQANIYFDLVYEDQDAWIYEVQ